MFFLSELFPGMIDIIFPREIEWVNADIPVIMINCGAIVYMFFPTQILINN